MTMTYLVELILFVESLIFIYRVLIDDIDF